MAGLSSEDVREILERRFPDMSREAHQAIEIIFESLVNRLTLVRLSLAQQCGVLADQQLTIECLVYLVCEDLRSGGKAPAYIKLTLVEGSVGGTEGWIVLTFKEWSGGK